MSFSRRFIFCFKWFCWLFFSRLYMYFWYSSCLRFSSSFCLSSRSYYCFYYFATSYSNSKEYMSALFMFSLLIPPKINNLFSNLAAISDQSACRLQATSQFVRPACQKTVFHESGYHFRQQCAQLMGHGAVRAVS